MYVHAYHNITSVQLDHTCNKYCAVIGQEQVFTAHEYIKTCKIL